MYQITKKSKLPYGGKCKWLREVQKQIRTLDYLLGEDEEDKPKEAAMMRVRIAMSLLKDVEKLLDEA